jgi:hypothetical protein
LRGKNPRAQCRRSGRSGAGGSGSGSGSGGSGIGGPGSTSISLGSLTFMADLSRHRAGTKPANSKHHPDLRSSCRFALRRPRRFSNRRAIRRVWVFRDERPGGSRSAREHAACRRGRMTSSLLRAGAAFSLRGGRLDRGVDGAFPGVGDAGSPPAAETTEVGSELAFPGQL